MRFTRAWAERIIPAFAGSTTTDRTLKSWRADHPRIRGEHPRGEQVAA